MNGLEFLKSFLLDDPYLSSIYVVMVTLDSAGVASYAETRLYYIPAPARQMTGGGFIPGRFMNLDAGSAGIDQPKFNFGNAIQVFSDRVATGPLVGSHIGLPHHGLQKFDETRADSLRLEMTYTDPVRVTVMFKSLNDAVANFTVSCEPGGFMYGSTPDAKYLFRITKWGE
jgi:hypothetical protein